MTAENVRAFPRLKETIVTRIRAEGGAIREGIVTDARDLLELREVSPQEFWNAVRQLVGEGCIEVETAADFRTVYRLCGNPSAHK